jgi:hypothetical protein
VQPSKDAGAPFFSSSRIIFDVNLIEKCRVDDSDECIGMSEPFEIAGKSKKKGPN